MLKLLLLALGLLAHVSVARRGVRSTCPPLPVVTLTTRTTETPVAVTTTVRRTDTYYTKVTKHRAEHTATVFFNVTGTVAFTCWPNSTVGKVFKRGFQTVVTDDLPISATANTSPLYANSSSISGASSSPMASILVGSASALTVTLSDSARQNTSQSMAGGSWTIHVTRNPSSFRTKAAKEKLTTLVIKESIGDTQSGPATTRFTSRLSATESKESAPGATLTVTATDGRTRPAGRQGSEAASQAEGTTILIHESKSNRPHRKTAQPTASSLPWPESHRGRTYGERTVTKTVDEPCPSDNTALLPTTGKRKRPAISNASTEPSAPRRGRLRTQSPSATSHRRSRSDCRPSTVTVYIRDGVAPTPTVTKTARRTKIKTSTVTAKKRSSTTTVSRARTTATTTTTMLGGRSGTRHTDLPNGKAVFDTYGDTDFPLANITSCSCGNVGAKGSSAPCSITGRNYTCNGFDGCMNLCATYNTEPDGPLCAGVSYAREQMRGQGQQIEPAWCHLKWIVPPYRGPVLPAGCGVASNTVDSAILCRQDFL